MRRTLIIGSAVAVLTLLVGAAPLGAATPDITTARNIHLIEKERVVTFLDLGTKGLTPGDRQEISSDLFDLQGHHVGRADLDAVITATGQRAGGILTGVISLPGGQITSQSFASLGAGGGENLQPVTGGSGVFQNVRGQIRILSEHGNTANFVIELLP